MITPLLRLGAIAFLVIGSGFLVSSSIAETESESSSDIFSEPIRNELRESVDGTEVQLDVPADIPGKTKKKPAQIGDIIEVNPRSENWDLIHSGDLNRGTIKFKFPGK
ncbi:MAG: hypothetical protein QNJ72_14890 [Pleurocapsa sp. MO_226.B13]|nr:hypothetical protein [Pleurocapsa sp. MO_226.B13]